MRAAINNNKYRQNINIFVNIKGQKVRCKLKPVNVCSCAPLESQSDPPLMPLDVRRKRMRKLGKAQKQIFLK